MASSLPSLLARPTAGTAAASTSYASAAPSLPPRRHNRQTIAANAKAGSGKEEGAESDDNDEQARKAKKAIAASAAAAASLLAAAPPAAAFEHPIEGGWRHVLRPRRHLRAMGDFERDRLLRVRDEEKLAISTLPASLSLSLTSSVSLSNLLCLSPSPSLPLSKTNNANQDERRAEQEAMDSSKASRKISVAETEDSLPEASNLLDAVADDAAAAVEGAAAAARSAAASLRGWVMGSNKEEARELPPAPVRGGGGSDGTYFRARAEASTPTPAQQPRYRPGPSSYSSSSSISPEATSAITTGLALLAAVAAITAIARRVSTGSWGSRRKKGRWIRDRSLGGKMIFVEDEFADSASKLRKSMNADLFLDGEGEEDPSKVAASRVAAAASAADGASRKATTTMAATKQQQQQQLPSWWSPPRSSPSFPAASSSSSPPSTRFERDAAAAALREDPTFVAATATLRQLEDSKLSGRDYSVSSLAAIRRALGDSGVALKPRTASQRDAMFRAAAEAAAEEASSSSSSSSESGGSFFSSPLGGIPPNEFVSGCASDLGVPAAEAANLSLAAVAAKARALLVDALASRRGGDPTEALLLVARLASLLSALPLPLGGPQAPMVAEALSQRATLEERRALFEEFVGVVGSAKAVRQAGSRERAAAVVAAECLGFDPELVVPARE